MKLLDSEKREILKLIEAEKPVSDKTQVSFDNMAEKLNDGKYNIVSNMVK